MWLYPFINSPKICKAKVNNSILFSLTILDNDGKIIVSICWIYEMFPLNNE